MTRSPWLLGALILVLVGAGACADDDDPEGYSADTRAALMTGCAEDDTDPDLVAVCECSYDTAEEELPFDEFAGIESRLADGETALPGEWVEIVRRCIREVSATRG